MKPRTRLLLGIALTFLTLAPLTASAADPVCAVLDPGKTDRAALLEAKLLAEPGLSLVERQSIDKVLQEQALQAAFGPQGVGDRVKLGKLLKADVLVLVRRVAGATPPALEVVVSETAGGLRLLSRVVPQTASADADVAALLGLAREGLKKHGAAVKEVIAVPPFLSNDLTGTHDRLKAALARLAEQAALARPGAVVVELAEAEALARELKLAGGEKLARPLPLYLLGEYRHEGRGAEQTLTVKLRTERGGQPVGKPAEATGKPDATAARVRTLAADLLAAAGGKAAPPTDPKAEATQLAARARDFQRSGQQAEALDLFEAALLLTPDQHRVRIEAAHLIGAAMRRYVPYDIGTPTDPAAFRGAVRLHRQARAHAEVLLAHAADLEFQPLAQGLQGWMGSRTPSHEFLAAATGDVKDLIREVQREDRDRIVPLLPVLTRAHPGLSTNVVRAVLQQASPRERYVLLEQIAVQLKDLPRAAVRTEHYVTIGGYITEAQDTPELRAFIDRLAAHEHPELRAAAALLKSKLPRPRAPKAETVQAAPKPEPDRPQGVRFRPVEFTAPANVRSLVGQFHAVVAAGPGVDAYVAYAGLYLMKEKGKLTEVKAVREKLGSVVSACFDGRFLWVVGTRGGAAGLLLLDPVSEEVRGVTAADGLPEPSGGARGSGFTSLVAAPVGPGRACVAGSFGPAWVADVAFRPESGSFAVRVLHEAKVVTSPQDGRRHLNPAAAFRPDFILVVRNGTGPAARVVIGRAGAEAPSNGPVLVQYPLVVDPDRPGGEVARVPFSVPTGIHTRLVPGPGGALYFAGRNGADPNLVRIGFPEPGSQGTGEAFGGGLVRTVLPLQPADALPAGPSRDDGTLLVVPQGDRIHVISRKIGTGVVQFQRRGRTVTAGRPAREGFSEWVAVGPDGTAARELADHLPTVKSIDASSHYGLVAVAFNDPKGGSAVPCTVEFGEPPPPRPAAASSVALAPDPRPAGQPAVVGRGVVCALVDPEQTTRGRMLADHLAADGGPTWADHAATHAAVQKDDAAALFAPAGGARRAQLGKAIKADVLVMVRPLKRVAGPFAPPPALELTVSETTRGIRLLTGAIPVTADAGADAAALAEMVRDALRKHAEGAAAVVAVPPVPGADSPDVYDPLRAALPKLVEQVALDRPGVVAVEPAEAAALAPTPLTLAIGLRHNGVLAGRTVTLTLQAERGGKPLGAPVVRTLPADAAADAVRRWTAARLDAATGTTVALPTSSADADRLTDRARRFQVPGYPDVLALTEAALLLDPDRAERYVAAARAVTLVMGEASAVPVNDRTADQARRVVALYRRGLDHVEGFVVAGGRLSRWPAAGGTDFVTTFHGAAAWLLAPTGGLNRAVRPVSDTARAEVKERLRQHDLLLGWQRKDASGPRQVAAELSGTKRPEAPRPPDLITPAAPTPVFNVRFRQLDLTWEGGPEKPGTHRPFGVAAAGPKTDVVWTATRNLYLMTEPGKLRWVGTFPGSTSVESVCFDGRFVWLASPNSTGVPVLVVLDPETGIARRVTAADGLPTPGNEAPGVPQTLWVAPAGPGRACLVGSYLGRAWVGVAAFDPAAKRASVSVMHETRSGPAAAGKDRWARTDVPFAPTYVLAVRGKPRANGPESVRVLVGRSGGLDLTAYPLVVDPDRRAVSVLADPLFGLFDVASANQSRIAEVGGVVYATEPTQDKPQLVRVGFPAVKEVLSRDVPDGRVVAVGDQLFVVEGTLRQLNSAGHLTTFTGGDAAQVRWWAVRPGRPGATPPAAYLPRAEGIFTSSHYGTVAVVPLNRGPTAHLVVVEATPQSGK